MESQRKFLSTLRYNQNYENTMYNIQYMSQMLDAVKSA